MPIIPKHLEPGAAIGLIAPASAPPEPKAVDHSVAALEKMGFKVKLGRNTRARWGFLAGHDRDRASDVMRMFTDSKIDGIVCVRGGYGTPRILPLLDYAAIRKNPKVFVGYSDITALHCAFLKLSNLISFHGPMTAAHFTETDYPEFSRNSWLTMLTKPTAVGSISKGYDQKTVSILRRGKVSGQLIGGNLGLLTSLTGTRYLPSFKGRILFLEDVDEKPYRMDRMLTHLLNAGLLQQVAGIAVGVCHECTDPKAKTAKEFRQTLTDVFKERLLSLNIPVIIGLPFGHVPFNATLPFGGNAILDANAGDLILTEPNVK
jgi:muramoyltetrapeptide carboxypeptidase